MTESIIKAFAAEPIPVGCCTESGRWVLRAEADRDITIAEGATVELFIVDSDKAVNIDIDVRQGGVLRIVEVVAEHSATQLSIAIAKHGECVMTQVVTSPSDVRVAASLVEGGASFKHNGCFILVDQEQGSVTVDVNHMAAECTSHTSVKGVAADKAHGSFSGLVYVAPGAQHTDSVQSSRNVTIGEARIETLPQLEIYADDVKCSHGATVGQMDSDAILYMRQRGLSTAQAKRLQIEGFVQDVAMHSAIESLAEELMAIINTKLNSL
ncbi:MAG: SufD family Fe-S cluster assembly protein [Alistipes sp.]|nr:SufD family Fe-S cluster assembly protein [Alistipes sp.]